MDAPIGDGEDSSMMDFYASSDAASTDNQLDLESLHKEIERVLETLDERDRKVIRAFYGIGEPELTLEEIGVKYNLTKERVRQIREKAIRKIRHNTKNQLLKSYLGR